MSVRVVDHVHKLARLREESADFAIAPAAQNTFAVSHEANTVGFDVIDLDAQHFLPVLRIPDPDIVFRASRENIRIPAIISIPLIFIYFQLFGKKLLRESHVIDFVVVACVSELGIQLG